MKICTMRRRNAPPEQCEITWEALRGWLSNPTPTTSTKDELGGWVPISLLPGKFTREAESCEAVHLLVLDLDQYTKGDKNNPTTWIQPQHIAETHQRLQQYGLAYAWHTSYSYNPAGPLKYRFIVPLSEPVNPRIMQGDVKGKRWRAFWLTCAQLICPHPERKTFADSACADPTHFYYGPWHPQNGPQPDAGWREGQPLDPAPILAVSDKIANPAPAQYQSGNTGEVSEITLQMLERALPREIAKIKSPHVRRGWEALERVCRGERYADPGERDETMFSMAHCMCLAFPFATAEAMCAFLGPAVEVVGERGAEERTKLLDKLTRCMSAVQGQLAGENPIRFAQIGRTGPYTPEEITGFLTGQKLATADALSAQLLVVHRSDVYVFYNGDYVYAGNRESCEDYVRQRLQLATTLPNVTLREMNKQGGVTEKSIKSMLRDYCVAVRNVTPSFTLQESYIDHERETLMHAICPRRTDLTPTRHADVEQWLAGVEPQEKFLDWLATAPNLTKPTAALYMHGHKHRGKTLLAQGLSTIWGDAPVDLASMEGNFNGDLTSNPIVFADETLPESFKKDTGLLRRLITAHHTKLKRKFMQESNLMGALRVLIAKNNLELFPNNTELLTAADIDALSERILYVEMRQPTLLANPQAVAEHILWLEQTRKVEASGRLWVAGEESPLHRNLRVSSRYRSLVCQWLMGLITNPTAVADSKKFYRLDETGLHIAPGLIYDRWEVYCARERLVLRRDICRVIEEIGIKRGSLYQIKLDDLEQYGATHGYHLTVEDLGRACAAGGQVMQRSVN